MLNFFYILTATCVSSTVYAQFFNRFRLGVVDDFGYVDMSISHLHLVFFGFNCCFSALHSEMFAFSCEWN